MGNVGEGTAVHKRRRALERLNQVGFERILEQRRHSALSLEVAGTNGLAGKAVADDDLAQTLLKVVNARGQAQDCHDLGGDGDVEAVLARHALGLAANAVDDMAQLTIVHVDDALPGDALDVDAELVTLLNVVVEHSGQQVVGGTDGMEVTGKVQVNVLHGDDLGPTAAGGTALHAKHGTERRLAQGHGALNAATTQAVGQADGRGGLALARGRGVDSGHEDKLCLVISWLVEQGIVDLCLVKAVRNQMLNVDAGVLGHLGNRQRRNRTCDFDVSRHGRSFRYRMRKRPIQHSTHAQ